MSSDKCKMCGGTMVWRYGSSSYECVLCGYTNKDPQQEHIVDEQVAPRIQSKYKYASKVFEDSGYSAHTRTYSEMAEDQLATYLNDNNIAPEQIVSVNMSFTDKGLKKILLVYYNIV